MLMTILRGVPGSGKSHLANLLLDVPGTVVYSTDDFFMVDGEYRFDPKKLGSYHAANQRRAREACAARTPHIVIDNTHVKAWEAREYVRMAFEHDYKVVFVEPTVPWAKDAEECAKRNTHGVPLETIKRMLDGWETFTADDCLKAKAPWE